MSKDGIPSTSFFSSYYYFVYLSNLVKLFFLFSSTFVWFFIYFSLKSLTVWENNLVLNGLCAICITAFDAISSNDYSNRHTLEWWSRVLSILNFVSFSVIIVCLVNCVCVCIHHMVTYIHTGIEWRRWRSGDVILILESIQLHRIALNNDDDDSEIFISDCIWHRSRIYMDLHDDLSCGTDSFFLLIIRISSVDSTKRIEMYSLAEFNGSKSRRTKDGRYWRNVCVWGRMAQLFE